MRNFLLGALVGALLVFFVVPLFGLLIWAASRGGQPPVPSDTALEISLRGDVPEHADMDWTDLLQMGDRRSPIDLYTLTEAIRFAAEDEKIKALVLRGGGSQAGWAKAQETRWAIQEFKKSGKPVWAYLEIAGREDYYIASLADKVVLQPESYLDLKGLRLEVMFYKGTLEKLGVEVELIRTGKYKSAGEPFTREEISPEWRTVLDQTLDEFYGQLLSGIADGRGRDAQHWGTVLDEGPFTSGEAQMHGLIDDVLYRDAFFDQLNEAASVEDLSRLSVADYARRALPNQRQGEKIAIMHAIGPITSRSAWSGPFGPGTQILDAQRFIPALEKLRKDESIAGVVLRIDSPGGEAIASEQMLRAVRQLAEEKPLVVSMSTLAASGGYYIASAPDVPIVAYPGTYTGSIGVFTLMFKLHDLYEKLGITKEILTRGRFAAIDSDYESMSGAEREKLREYVDSIYDTFLARVAEGRGLDIESVQELAQGRVWIGSQALDNGLVDELGGYREAIAQVKKEADIDEDSPVQIVSYPPQQSMIQSLLSPGGQSAGSQLLEVPILGRLQQVWIDAGGWAPWMQGGTMFTTPYAISVD
ncbi:MAG: signal peptide peptidase SppA [Bryobacterales bacterium]|nr:signal peptide peptidase SppA [Bryobacterales bacterium]